MQDQSINLKHAVSVHNFRKLHFWKILKKSKVWKKRWQHSKIIITYLWACYQCLHQADLLQTCWNIWWDRSCLRREVFGWGGLSARHKFLIKLFRECSGWFSYRVEVLEHDCSSHDMTTHFRRGQSKVYYASEVWDPGSEDEEFARTSFRSGSDRSVVEHDHHHHQAMIANESYCNNDDFVASLMRRTSVEKSMYR